MRIRTVFLLAFALSSCSASKNLKTSDCNENIKFKDNFYKNIAVVEKFTVEHSTISPHTNTIDVNTFFKSLDFITKHSKIPYPDAANLQIGYTSMEKFQDDKKKWLNWYELNKCKNLH